MLFYWLRLARLRIVWLFKIPLAREIARIKSNSRCPICGGLPGTLRCVHREGVVAVADQTAPVATPITPTPVHGQPVASTTLAPAPVQMRTKPTMRVLCQHTCGECGARWFENPIVNVSTEMVLYSLPRGAREKMQDTFELLSKRREGNS